MKSHLIPGLPKYVMLHSFSGNRQGWSVDWVGRSQSPGLSVVFGPLAESGMGPRCWATLHFHMSLQRCVLVFTTAEEIPEHGPRRGMALSLLKDVWKKRVRHGLKAKPTLMNSGFNQNRFLSTTHGHPRDSQPCAPKAASAPTCQLKVPSDPPPHLPSTCTQYAPSSPYSCSLTTVPAV